MMAAHASGLVEKRPVRWDIAASVMDWKMVWGARLSPVKGVGRAEQKNSGSSELLLVFRRGVLGGGKAEAAE
jgi:hypothetical protein